MLDKYHQQSVFSVLNLKDDNLRTEFIVVFLLLIMGKFCEECQKLMKNPDLSHCSDECLFEDIKNSKSLKDDAKDAEFWNEKTNPWK
jgi:hypothetical protein